MAFHNSDSPERDWDAYCREQEEAMENLPECVMCGTASHAKQGDRAIQQASTVF